MDEPSVRPARSACRSCLTGRQLRRQVPVGLTCNEYRQDLQNPTNEGTSMNESDVSALAGAAALALAAGGAAAQQKKLKIGFIYVGPVGDHGWSYQHDRAARRSRRPSATRSRPPTSRACRRPIPSAPSSSSRAPATGSIFTTSFGFMEPTLKVAKKYPNVKFEHATGFKRAPNLATYAAKFHEGRYIIGQIAGKMTKRGTIGYVGAFPIPEVVAGINSYFLGAQSVNPNVKIKVVWANSWYDPAKEADAAKALLDQGVDVIAQHTDSPAPLQAAEARGKFGFGQASDMERFAPKAQLTAIIDNWADYYVERTKAALDGTWKSGDTWGGLARRHGGDVALQEHAGRREEARRGDRGGIKSGKLNPFNCPLTKQDGSQVECKGKRRPLRRADPRA